MQRSTPADDRRDQDLHPCAAEESLCCFICLSNDVSDQQELKLLCQCKDRHVHPRCAARWQLHRAGRLFGGCAARDGSDLAVTTRFVQGGRVSVPFLRLSPSRLADFHPRGWGRAVGVHANLLQRQESQGASVFFYLSSFSTLSIPL